MATKDEDFVTRLFVANTHAPILFFSSKGQVYKTKVWRLPLAAPQGRGKALINMLPLDEGERIGSMLLLPENEEDWGKLDVMFATTRGSVRRNKLSDFVQVNRNGKIAMKLEEGEGIVGVETCTEADDVLLTTARGQCIRFPVDDVRVFKGRDSMGVRGINLAEGDTIISMAILGHVEATAEERATFLKRQIAARRALSGEVSDAEIEGVPTDAEDAETLAGDAPMPPERLAELGAKEQFVLTLSENGYGKRTSSYEYRITGRGGKGIVAMAVNERNGKLIASFPVEDSDQIMLVTDGGQLIRCPVDGIRIAGRPTQGVTVFNTADDQKVMSVERIRDDESGDDGESTDEGDGDA
jgi:DNA gyrase subunit A